MSEHAYAALGAPIDAPGSSPVQTVEASQTKLVPSTASTPAEDHHVLVNGNGFSLESSRHSNGRPASSFKTTTTSTEPSSLETSSPPSSPPSSIPSPSRATSTPLTIPAGQEAFVVQPIPENERSVVYSHPSGAPSTTSVAAPSPATPITPTGAVAVKEPSPSEALRPAPVAVVDPAVAVESTPDYKKDVPRVNPAIVEPLERDERMVQVEKIKADHRELIGAHPKGTVVSGIEDDRLWAMLRRFDKQITHALSPPHGLPEGQPDLRRSPLPTVPFNSDTVRSNLERCYATGGIAGIRFVREMQRLMSWSVEDRQRTSYFCAAYFIAWIFHMTTPLLVLFVLVLIVEPRSRPILFPVIPPPPGQAPSATDPTNKKGDESIVGVVHPQTHRSKSEQVEEQSYELMKTVEKFGLRVLIGGRKKPSEYQLAMARGGDDSEEEEEGVAETRAKNVKEVKTEVLQEGGTVKEANEKEAVSAKEHRDAMVGIYAKALQDGLGDFADFSEMLTNCLSPPAVYPNHHAREKLAYGVFLPILVLVTVIPSRYFAHLFSFAFGFGFFGQPLIIRGVKTFIRWVPDWQEQLDLRNSIFAGVPTSAQLTLYVLRQRELALDPLPRPPVTATSKAAQKELNDTSVISEAHAERTTSSVGEGDEAHMVGDGDHDDGEGGGSRSAKAKSRLVAFGQKIAEKGATFRGHGKIEVLPEAAPGAKKPKKSIKSKLSNFLLNRTTLDDKGSIWAYPCRLSGTTGHIIIDYDADEGDISTSSVVFLPKGASEPTKSFPLTDIVELKKGGVGLPRSVLGWAAGMELGGTGLEVRIRSGGSVTQGREVAPGVWVTNVLFEDEEDENGPQGEVVQFERIGRRDQLFIRLLSISPNLWETL